MANLKSDSDDRSISALKKQWRQRLKNVRQTLNPNRREQASAQANQQLKEWTQSADWVLSFASFSTEINLWSLNQKLAAERRLVLPRLINGQIHLFCVTDINHLEPHAWGFLEPNIFHCSAIDASLIEIALIPGLGFDLQTKYRLGYGQGCYDRLLTTASFSQRWGIGFLEQAIENLPYTNQDIPLSYIHLF